ncbi:hypothetical protein MKZ38_001292 [Zalerion maritima]|uniref:Uncharacterized protein n=1 Tax=Zalerion maritima TaxID=339359 RepID=A0AAD5RRN1_9PEZI|nr:hypothetical protein MKZ38_001292 [Zalerion maritima]
MSGGANSYDVSRCCNRNRNRIRNTLDTSNYDFFVQGGPEAPVVKTTIANPDSKKYSKKLDETFHYRNANCQEEHADIVADGLDKMLS